MRRLLSLALLLLVSAFAFGHPGELSDYVEHEDSAFAFERETTIHAGSTTVHVLRLTSQNWRGLVWTHRLTLFLPPENNHPEAALLHISSGSNAEERPLDLTSRDFAFAVETANEAGVAVAVLEQVPNQPLFDGLYEDDLIAYTFSRRIETGEEDWPLLFPMVKSAVRAMDAVTAFLRETDGRGPETFIVTGASKRGWTTWLTAAVDSRIAAIVPMVFDILHFSPQLELQRATFEGYSEMIQVYEEQNLFALLETERGKVLGALVDPFTYREKIDMPKLILLGTNDPYWTVDAASLYFNDLRGPSHLFYAPNSGHQFHERMKPVLHAFVKRTLSENTTMPRLRWDQSNGNLTAQWDRAEAEARLWTAHSPTRDFRSATWRSEKLETSGNEAAAALTEPADGFSARYIEVRFPTADGPAFGLTTEIAVTPARRD